ncbi:MAG TPA: 1-acyl-sn-glycerol-3-phosphate acyltransferase [Vicinamibacterales bacterium]|nr:1-acyl-sn-glycerol-3-phosphate acyltransferase [Vicinamibacterales bacterium]
MFRGVNPVVRWLAGAASWVFYRVDCVGEVPADGALILLPNHPNALLDPAVVWATAGRDVRFLAKSTLFAGPLRPFLQGAGAIPVYRRMDPGADTSRNAETFAAVAGALAAGDAICLFPEGVSHSSGRLEPLRTGAARMALEAEREGTPVALVPVGLNFDRKTAFRSRVTVVYGKPFSGADLVASPQTDQAAAVRTLTDRMADHIRRLLIEADPVADAALVERVDRLYAAARGRSRDPEERLRRRQLIAGGMERLRLRAPERYEQILLQLRRYDQRLGRFGLRDRHLDWQIARDDVIRFAVRESLLLVMLGPLVLLGFALFFVPYRLTGLAARWFTRERDVLATAQVISGTIVYGLWLACVAWIAWRVGGPATAAAAALALPLLALGALFAIERESAVLDAVRVWLLLRRAHPRTRQRLQRRRSELADVLDEVHAWLMGEPADT